MLGISILKNQKVLQSRDIFFKYELPNHRKTKTNHDPSRSTNTGSVSQAITGTKIIATNELLHKALEKIFNRNGTLPYPAGIAYFLSKGQLPFWSKLQLTKEWKSKFSVKAKIINDEQLSTALTDEERESYLSAIYELLCLDIVPHWSVSAIYMDMDDSFRSLVPTYINQIANHAGIVIRPLYELFVSPFRSILYTPIVLYSIHQSLRMIKNEFVILNNFGYDKNDIKKLLTQERKSDLCHSIITKSGYLAEFKDLRNKNLIHITSLVKPPFQIGDRPWIDVDNFEDFILSSRLLSSYGLNSYCKCTRITRSTPPSVSLVVINKAATNKQKYESGQRIIINIISNKGSGESLMISKLLNDKLSMLYISSDTFGRWLLKYRTAEQRKSWIPNVTELKELSTNNDLQSYFNDYMLKIFNKYKLNPNAPVPHKYYDICLQEFEDEYVKWFHTDADYGAIYFFDTITTFNDPSIDHIFLFTHCAYEIPSAGQTSTTYKLLTSLDQVASLSHRNNAGVELLLHTVYDRRPGHIYTRITPLDLSYYINAISSK